MATDPRTAAVIRAIDDICASGAPQLRAITRRPDGRFADGVEDIIDAIAEAFIQEHPEDDALPRISDIIRLHAQITP